MKKATRVLLKQSTIYGIGNLLTKIVAFLLIPLYARKISPDQYGIIGILELVELFGTNVLVFGLGEAVLRYYHQYKKENQHGTLVFTYFIFLLTSNALILGAMYIYPEPLVSHLLELTPENVQYFRYILIVILCSYAQRMFMVVMRAEEKALVYISYSLTTFLLLLGLNIYKVGILNQGVAGIVESKLYVALLNLLFVTLFLLARFRVGISFEALKRGLKFGFPLVFVSVSLTILTLADRYFLKIYRDMSEVGIYSMTYKFGMIMNMVLITPFRNAFYPFLFKRMESEDVKKMLRKYFTYFLFVGFVFFLALSLFAREIQLLVTTEKYLAGYVLIPIIGMSYLLYGLRNFYTLALAIVEKTTSIAYTTILGALLNIGLNILFIPAYGMMGAAVATLLSYFFITATTYFIAQRLYPVPWDWGRVVKLATVGFILYGVSLLIFTQNIWVTIVLKLLLFSLFPLLLYFTGFLNQEEKKLIRNVLAQLRPTRV